MTTNISSLYSTIEKMIHDAEELLGVVIKGIGPSYQRARRARVQWTERHRLLVMVEAAQESLRMLPRSVREPWLLAQLSGCLEIVRKWRDDPSWKEIEPCLVNASDFDHVISMLMLAERLKAWGHNVRLITNGRNASPDLRVQAVGGRQDWLQIECYQPRSLSGKPVRLSVADSYKITKEAMKKAKRQLGNEIPSIIALCMYNQPRSNLDLLKKIVETRLSQTSRASLVGFIFMCQNNLQTSHEGTLSFSSGITLDFIQNPAYFGAVDISSNVPDDHPGSLIGPEIKEPLKEIIVNDFVILQREMQQAAEAQGSDSTGDDAPVPAPPKIEKLSIQIVSPRNRAVFVWSADNYSVYLEGQGNIDFRCGNCDTVLAKKIWKLSCSNIILQCPTCRFYNEFPTLESSLFLKTNNIAIEANDSPYRCATTIMMKRGICLFGVEHDYHLQHQRQV